MKIIIASTLGIALFFLFFFQYQKASGADVSSLSQVTQPTPPSNKSFDKIASPTPTCSPQPTPLSEEEKNNPLREMTPDDEINAALGTFDWDCDGVCNSKDNCIFAYNPDQKDGNGDGKGEVCDPQLVDASFKDSRCDKDTDGIPDFRDNCPMVCNTDQKFVDFNENKVNDLCDQAIPNFAFDKQCAKSVEIIALKLTNLRKISIISPSPTPFRSPTPKPLPEEEKYDPSRELDLETALNDNLGTTDWDCDGVPNIKDNCIFVYNPDQKVTARGGKPIACDLDLVGPSFQDSRCDEDHDGIPDFRDNCLLACNPDQKDLNKNGIGDACDRAFHGAGLTRRICERPRKIKVLKQQKISSRKKN